MTVLGNFFPQYENDNKIGYHRLIVGDITAVGFDTIMTVHHPPHQELYLTSGEPAGQCKLTLS